MLKNLRNRLFASYLIVLVIALVLVGSVTFTTLSQRETPPEFTWNRLQVMLTTFISQQNVRESIATRLDGEAASDALDEFAEANDVRIIVMANRRNDDDIALYDSDNEFLGNERPNLQEQNRPAQQAQGSPANNRLKFGRFMEDGEEWLYVSFEVDFPAGRQRGNEWTFIIAEPRSADSVRAAVLEFNESILRPLIRSAIIGGVIAFLLAIFLSRSITKPLQALAKSAQYVAKGEFTEQIPETGPAEIQQVATAFNRMTGEVRAAQQSQREFMANVSHDLKTPLTSIQGYSQAIMDGAASDPAKAASVIHDEAERLNRMVQELTDLARLQAGRLSMQLSPLDINAIVESMGERLAMVAAKDDISLTVKTSDTPIIAADGDRMVQVLTNIIGNAIKYTPSGGKILVETGVRNGGVEIVVRDNGIGIPQEDLPHIFDRFYQVDKSRGPSRGTGLGLAITQEIVQSHGGQIYIFSEGTNRGTTVSLWFPSPKVSTITTRRVNVD